MCVYNIVVYNLEVFRFRPILVCIQNTPELINPAHHTISSCYLATTTELIKKPKDIENVYVQLKCWPKLSSIL